MKRHVYYAWGVTFKGKYMSEIRLAYGQKKEAWRLGMLKFNCKTRQKFVARGGGVCRVKVTKQQVAE